MVSLLPWDDPAIVKNGSYVAALDSIGIPHAGQIMNVIVLTAVLSCLNSGLYTASRMAFSLGRRGDAPSRFARTNGRGVPHAAILARSPSASSRSASTTCGRTPSSSSC